MLDHQSGDDLAPTSPVISAVFYDAADLPGRL